MLPRRPCIILRRHSRTAVPHALQEYELELGASKAGPEADGAEPMAAE
jgi:hypothetical protein